MKIKFIVPHRAGGDGEVTLIGDATKVIQDAGDQAEIIYMWHGRKATARFAKQVENVQPILQKYPFTVCTTDSELLEATHDADVVFLGQAINKKVWPTIDETMAEVQKRIPVIGLILASTYLRNKKWFYTKSFFDGWWTSREIVKETAIRKGFASGDRPVVAGRNVYNLTCPYTPEELFDMKEPGLVTQTARFGTMKKSTHAMLAFSELLKRGYDNFESWGWSQKEGSPTWTWTVKMVPEMFELWHKLAPYVKGKYDHSDLERILSRAHFSLDLSYTKDDGSRYGDGGMQYTGIEALDWGALPVIDSSFHVGDEWDRISLRVDHTQPDRVAEAIIERSSNWDKQTFVDRVNASRQYLLDYHNREIFDETIRRVIEEVVDSRKRKQR